MSAYTKPSLQTEDRAAAQRQNLAFAFPAPREEAHFLGIRVHLMTMTELQQLVAAIIDARGSAVIANHNLHSLYLFHCQPKVRDFYSQAEWIHIDGMPIVSLARIFGYPAGREQRTTYADWLPHLMQFAAERGWRVFYLGSAPGVAESGAECFRQKFPGLQIRTRHGYFDMHSSAENEAVLRDISAFRPHVLLVGMGMPRQEFWIHANREGLSANVILPAGAAMDYVAGAVRTPPRWAGRIGLEWAFRLAVEPQRLWRRYLMEPWFLMGILLREWLANRISFARANTQSGKEE